jgi:hypothetical protein
MKLKLKWNEMKMESTEFEFGGVIWNENGVVGDSP